MAFCYGGMPFCVLTVQFTCGRGTCCSHLQLEYDESAWGSAEASGLVCLPAAGYRYGSSFQYVGDGGNYWSSTAYDEDGAYYVYFNSLNVYPVNYGYRSLGYSVRLVTELP